MFRARNLRKSLALPAVLIGMSIPQLQEVTVSTATTSAAATVARSGYVNAVLADDPVALLQGTTDLTGRGPAGMAVGGPSTTTLPNGDPALAFNGKGQYLQFADRRAFEVDATGVLTAEFWMRPDALQFADEEGSGYVYTMGKGTSGAHEWYTRMYSKDNAESRPNRISGYVFNPAGGLGSGSYFQDPVRVGEWIHVALVINAKATSAQYPMGYAKIYKNGALRDTDSLKDYNVVPKSGTAPLRIGTGYLNSFFHGAIGNVAFYDKELGAAQLQKHVAAISTPAPTSTSTPTTTEATASHVLHGANVPRTADRLVRYTRASGSSTGTNEYGFEAAVVGGKIVKVANGVGDMAIPWNGYVLSGHGEARSWLLAQTGVNSTVAISGGTVQVTAPTR